MTESKGSSRAIDVKVTEVKRKYCIHNDEHDYAMDLEHDVSKILHKIKDMDKFNKFLKDVETGVIKPNSIHPTKEKLVSEHLRLKHRELGSERAVMGPLPERSKGIIRKYLTILHGVHIPGYHISTDCCLISNSSLDQVIYLQLDDNKMKPRERSLADLFGPKKISTHDTNFARFFSTEDNTLEESKIPDAINKIKNDMQAGIDKFFRSFEESMDHIWRTRWLSLHESVYDYKTQEWCIRLYHPTIDLLNPPENLPELAEAYVEHRKKWLSTNPKPGAYWLWADAMRSQKNLVVPPGHVLSYADEYTAYGLPWHCFICDKSESDTDKVKTVSKDGDVVVY